MSEPIAGMKTDRLEYEIVMGAAPLSARASFSLQELVKRAKRADLFARQLRRIQDIANDEGLLLFEAYQQMHEVVDEIPNPAAASIRPPRRESGPLPGPPLS